MTKYDYEIVTELNNGTIRRNSYQVIIEKLGIGNKMMHGVKMMAGGTPQLFSLIEMMKKIIPEIKRINAYHEGNLIF